MKDVGTGPPGAQVSGSVRPHLCKCAQEPDHPKTCSLTHSGGFTPSFQMRRCDLFKISQWQVVEPGWDPGLPHSRAKPKLMSSS